MTGACSDGTYAYILGTNYTSDPVIEKFTSGGSVGANPYMDFFPGSGDTVYDTAWLDGGIWIARDNADSPILAYNTDGLHVGHVDGSTVSAAMGLTIDSDGYIWASNPDDDMIYQIEVTTGIEEGSTSPLDTRIIGVSRNPFHSAAVITGDGFNNAVIDIFDLNGRRVLSASFPGSYTWNAVKMPSGSYFVRVSDRAGSSSTRLIKID